MWQTFAFISAIFSALAAIFEKKALIKIDPVVFSLILSGFTLILALPFFFFVDFQIIDFAAIFVLYLKSVLGALAFLLVMYGIKKNELSNSLPLLVLTPAVVAVAAFFLLGESLSGISILGMFFLLLGSYFLQLEKGSGWLSPFSFLVRQKAQWYIIGAIVLFSVTSILDKTILRDFKLPAEAFIPIQ